MDPYMEKLQLLFLLLSPPLCVPLIMLNIKYLNSSDCQRSWQNSGPAPQLTRVPLPLTFHITVQQIKELLNQHIKELYY